MSQTEVRVMSSVADVSHEWFSHGSSPVSNTPPWSHYVVPMGCCDRNSTSHLTYLDCFAGVIGIVDRRAK